MLRATWANILEDLNGTLALCRELDLAEHVDASRFLEHRKKLLELIRALETGGQEAAFKVFDSDRLGSIVTLTESAELADLLPFLRSAPPKAVREKLVHVLGGPVLPSDEGSNTSQPRNILFELNLASKLWKAGLAPELGENPDLWVELGGKRLLFQCKRPTSVRAAQRSLGAAKDQLRGDFNRAPTGSRGVIALSLTKLLNPGDQIFRYTSEAAARKDLADRLEKTSQHVLSRWGGPGGDIVGMIYHAITPAADETAKLWMMVQQTNVEGFAKPGSLDERTFRGVYEALNRIWY